MISGSARAVTRGPAWRRTIEPARPAEALRTTPRTVGRATVSVAVASHMTIVGNPAAAARRSVRAFR
jgi:hypothetical protein